MSVGHLQGTLCTADGGVQVLSSLQQEPGMAPFCTEYAKLVRAVQQSHGALPCLCHMASLRLEHFAEVH